MTNIKKFFHKIHWYNWEKALLESVILLIVLILFIGFINLFVSLI